MNWNKYPKKSKKPGMRKTIEEKGYRELIPVLDKEFSIYVRMKAADGHGVVKCVTCGARHLWTGGMTLGHYISRAHHSVRWNEMNSAPQCVRCNSYRAGEPHKMRAYLVEKYGEEAIKEVERFAEITKTETAESLRMKIIEYREKIRLLKMERGL